MQKPAPDKASSPKSFKSSATQSPPTSRNTASQNKAPDNQSFEASASGKNPFTPAYFFASVKSFNPQDSLMIFQEVNTSLQRNLQTLTEVQKVCVQGVQELAECQSEIWHELMSSFNNLLPSNLQNGQADSAYSQNLRQNYTQLLEHMQKLAALSQNTGTTVQEIFNTRFNEMAHEHYFARPRI